MTHLTDWSYRKVGYFTQWGIYGRAFLVKDLVTSGSAAKLTHVNYAFANVSEDGHCFEANLAGEGDAWADYQRPASAADSVDGVADSPDQALKGNFNQLRKLKARYLHLKRRARHPHPLAIGTQMVLGGQRAHQRAPLPGGQGRVCGLADQRIAEQRDGPDGDRDGRPRRLQQVRRTVAEDAAGLPAGRKERARVAKQPPATGPGGHRPRLGRPPPPHRRRGSHTDRRHRVRQR